MANAEPTQIQYNAIIEHSAHVQHKYFRFVQHECNLHAAYMQHACNMYATCVLADTSQYVCVDVCAAAYACTQACA